MLPEVYFLRYAFPCARVLVDFRKTLTEKEYDGLQQAVETDTPIRRDFLEDKFAKAIQGMKKISEDYWTVDTIREYFWNRHEENLSPDLPELITRLCVVRKGRLEKKIEKEGQTFFRVDIGSGDLRIVIPLYERAKEGDLATIHYGYAVEKVE